MTATLTWTLTDTADSDGILIRYRLTGADWTELDDLLAASETDAEIEDLLDNRLYEFQVINKNTAFGDLATAIVRSIKFTEPEVTLTPNDTTMNVLFSNLSSDIGFYQIKIKDSETETQAGSVTITAGDPTVNHTFTGLDPETDYTVTVKVIVSTFNETFEYEETTLEEAICPNPLTVTATLVTD